MSDWEDRELRRGPLGLLQLALAAPCWGWTTVMVGPTLQWVPDCGGLMYGVPVPYVQAWMGSSLRYQLAVWPLLLDFACATVVLAASAWWLSARVRPGPRMRAVVLLTALSAVPASCHPPLLMAMSRDAATSGWGLVPLIERPWVHDLHAINPHVGFWGWSYHLEPSCN